MSVLVLKQQISRLSVRDRDELHTYLLRLRRATPEWRRATAKKIRDVQAGKGTPIEALEARYARG